MKKYNFTEIVRNGSEGGQEIRISCWFTSEKRDEVCLLRTSIYKPLPVESIYATEMKVEHSMKFKIDNTKEIYLQKLESGLEKEIKRIEEDDRYDKYNLQFFKDTEILKKFSEELEKGETEKELPIKDITKKTPLFDSKEILKLSAGDKHYVTLSTDIIYNSIINIKYDLEGVPAYKYRCTSITYS